MPREKVCCAYGLIGEELDLKANIEMEFRPNGTIHHLKYEDPPENLLINENSSHLLMPGLINSHVHIGDSFAKEWGYNKDLVEVVAPPDGIKHQLLASAPESLKKKAMQHSARDMLAHGFTHFVDFRERGTAGIELLHYALRESDITYLILGRFSDAQELEDVYERADGIGFSSYKGISKEIKEKLRALKKTNPKIVACHDAERKRDEINFQEIIGDGLIDLIVHGTHYTEKDLQRVKQKNLKLVLCPRCNGYFGVGFPPISEILKLNIPISLGTDNIMANNPDLFEEMRYLYYTTRNLQLGKDPTRMEARDLLKMITINAARNFNLGSNLGSISEGKYADFINIDLSAPNYFSKLTSETIYPLLVQRTQADNIRQVYKKGELVLDKTSPPK